MKQYGERGYWYCEDCRSEILSRNVTHEEKHDTCGRAATWMEFCALCSMKSKEGHPVYHEGPVCREAHE